MEEQEVQVACPRQNDYKVNRDEVMSIQHGGITNNNERVEFPSGPHDGLKHKKRAMEYSMDKKRVYVDIYYTKNKKVEVSQPLPGVNSQINIEQLGARDGYNATSTTELFPYARNNTAPPEPSLFNDFEKRTKGMTFKKEDKMNLKDIKLTKFIEDNPDIFPPIKPERCMKFSPFYLYTLIIFGATIFFLVSPKNAMKVTKYMIEFITSARKLQEPLRTFIFAAILYSHQLLGIPLQIVSIGLICFVMKSFFYGYVLTIIVNLTSSCLVFCFVRFFCAKRVEEKFKDNAFIQVIKAEAAINPWKVSFLFRFMNLPGLYKNLGLALAKLNITIFFIPAILEVMISNVIVCMAGVAMESGVNAMTPNNSKKKTNLEIFITYFSFVMAALQIICICIGAIITAFKIKKIRYLQRMISIRKSREIMEQNPGYIHDFETMDINISAEKKPENVVIEMYRIESINSSDLPPSIHSGSFYENQSSNNSNKTPLSSIQNTPRHCHGLQPLRFVDEKSNQASALVEETNESLVYQHPQGDDLREDIRADSTTPNVAIIDRISKFEETETIKLSRLRQSQR